MRSIYRFHVDCGRHGSLYGMFTAEQEDIAFAVGKAVHFYEPWGRHSEVSVKLHANAFAVVSSVASDVEVFERLVLSHGHRPLGLLSDSIADGQIELTAEERANAPAYFQRAVRTSKERGNP